jgi:hypothetical protein
MFKGWGFRYFYLVLVSIILIPSHSSAATIDIAEGPSGGYGFAYRKSHDPNRPEDYYFQWRVYTKFTAPVWEQYRVDISYEKDMTKEKCLKNSFWKPLANYEHNVPIGVTGDPRIYLKSPINRDDLEGPAVFRLVAVETSGLTFTPKDTILTCGTVPILPHINSISDATTVALKLDSVPTGASVKIDGKPLSDFNQPKSTTKVTVGVPRDTGDNTPHKITFTLTGYKPAEVTTTFNQDEDAFTAQLKPVNGTENSTVTNVAFNGDDAGGEKPPPPTGPSCSEQYITFTNFNPGGWVLCQMHALGAFLADLLSQIVGVIPLNTWPYIRDTNGVIIVWTISLGLIDLIVVVGLLVAAFANIFRFKIDTYGIKQILPGLIIGIVLANLSFFIMRLFLEAAAIITQAIGQLVGQYVSSDIQNRGATTFLAKQLWDELSNSLFTLPDSLIRYGVVSGGASVPIGLATSPATVPFATLTAIVILMFTSIPLILMLALMVVFYIRHYILMLLFMVAPIAFFSLGFPPLKALVWQKWWGTFWKWLLMLPVSAVLLGFAIIFLHFANANNNGKANLSFYALINGVSFAIIFLAYRLPFMWGSVFGVGVLPKWENLGAKSAGFMYERSRRLNNFAFDRGVGGIAGKYASVRKKVDPLELGPIGAAGSAERKKFQKDYAVVRSEAQKLDLKRETGESIEKFGKRVNATRLAAAKKKASDDAARATRRWNPNYNIRALPEAFQLREAARLRGETTAVRGTSSFKTVAGREGAYRFYQTDDREMINSIEDLPQAMERLGGILENKGIAGIDLEKIRAMAPGEIAASPKFAAIKDAQDLAHVNLLVGKIQNLGRSRSASTKRIFRTVYESQGPGWKFGESWDPDKFEAARNPRGGGSTPYAGMDPDEVVLNTTTGAKAPIARQQQAFMAMAQAAQNQEMPIETMDKMLKTIRRRMDRLDRLSGRKSIGYQDFANLGVSRAQYQAVRPQMSEYIGQRKQFTEAVDQGNLVGETRRDELGSAREIAKQIASAQGSNVDSIRQELNTFRTTLNQPQVDSAQLGQIRASLEKIHPSIGISAQIEQDPIELQGALKKAVQQSWDATSLLNESAMKHAVSQGENVDDALNQTLRVRQIKEHTTQEMARLVDDIGPVDTAAIRTNQDVINHISPSIHSVIEYHEPLQNQMEGLGAAAQQDVINRTAGEFAAQIAEHARTLGPDTNILQSVSSDEDQRERFSHQLDDIIQAQIAAIKSGATAQPAAGTVVSPSPAAPQPKASVGETAPPVQPTAEQPTPPPAPEPPPNLP